MESRRKWYKQAEVVVIGFGAAGSVAAIEAHDSGSKVLVLEVMPVGGGACRISGGGVYGCDTLIQKASGILDSPSEMYKYNMAIGKDLVDPELAYSWAQNCGKLVDWLAKLGVQFVGPTFSGKEELYANLAKPAPRAHRAKGEGAGLWEVLERNVAERGIECLFETRATELVFKHGACGPEVHGVKAESKCRGELYIEAKKAVILCTGGYSTNAELFKKFCTKSLPAKPNPMMLFDNGDGIAMGQSLGADLLAIDNVGLRVLILRGWPSSSYATYVSHPPNGRYVWVNSKGKRFMNEESSYSDAPLILAKQCESRCYMIFDESTKKTGGENIGWRFSHDLEKEIEGGAVKKADTVEGLAKIIGVDPVALEKTVYDWNKKAAEGKDSSFGRDKVSAIETSPFYAGDLEVYVVSSYGGLRINVAGQVVDVFGRIISRLYAAGSATGGFFGKLQLGGGALLSRSLTFGRIAGREASRQACWK